MRPSQDLSGGPDSTNLQAGRDITVSGVSAAEARQIALDVYNNNYLKLAGIAESIARDRAERITREFIEALQERNPGGLASMSDPDMLQTLYVAQGGYARSGEEDLEVALIDLLIDRAGQAELDLKTHILNQAVATLPKLTKKQRAATAVIFCTRYTRYAGPFDLSAFYDHLNQYLVPFVVDIPEGEADFGYMEYAGVGSVSTMVFTPLANIYQELACGFFSNGFTREAAPDPWVPFLDDSEVFMPCLRDPRKLQIRAESMPEVQELAKAKGIPTLVTHASTGRMQIPEIKADMIARLPALDKLYDKWGELGTPALGRFNLTAIGIAIGHACQRRVVGEVTPLEEFLR